MDETAPPMDQRAALGATDRTSQHSLTVLGGKPVRFLARAATNYDVRREFRDEASE